MERWIKVNGYQYYEVSSFGNVRSITHQTQCLSRWGSVRTLLIPGKLLKPAYYSNGYQFVALSENGTVTQKLLHRIVATAFLPNPLNKAYVNHKDGNKVNNHVDNLEWVTPTENAQHAILTGLTNMKSGDNPYSRSVTVERDGIKKQFETQREAAQFIGAKEVTLSASRKYNRILNGYKIY